MSYNAPPPPPPPVGGAPAASGSNSKALWALILGILSIFCCGFIAGIPALILGNSAKKEIDASGGLQTGRGMAQAGVVLGIISIVLTILWIILYAAGVVHFSASTSP